MSVADLSGWLVAQSIQLSVVFAVVFVLDAWIARRGSVALRGALWAAFFVKLALPPQLASPVSIARVFSEDGGAARVLAVRSVDESQSGLAGLIVGVWVIGCAVCVTLALARMRRARGTLLANARAAAPSVERVCRQLALQRGQKRAPKLRVSDENHGPATLGLFDPVILVPRALVRRPRASALEHVLLHELAHVRRRDAWRALAWTLARCVYWFHPLVHVAARRAALLREIACDEAAASAAHDGTNGYRRTLLELARPLLGPVPAINGFGGSGAMIVARLQRLSHTPCAPRARCDVLAVTAFVLLCACCLPLGVRSLPDPSLPALSEVDGCLRKRFIVMAELARTQEHAPASAND
ncbi:MAG: M56 family metallopeptidase [Planctomycetes bacterium]|nr:M56 family metallopeptidase [Planctomycetota bacterium]